MGKINKKFAGFTLIELLVVIVIIGILATISISTYGNFMKKATDAKRSANLKQIAKILQIDRGIEGDIVGPTFGKWGTALNNIYLLGTINSDSTCNSSNGELDIWGNPCLENILSQKMNIDVEENVCYVMIGDYLDNAEDKYNDFLVAIVSAENEDELLYEGTIRAKSYIEGVNEDKYSPGCHIEGMSCDITLKNFLLGISKNMNRYNGHPGCTLRSWWRDLDTSDPNSIQFGISPFGTKIE